MIPEPNHIADAVSALATTHAEPVGLFVLRSRLTDDIGAGRVLQYRIAVQQLPIPLEAWGTNPVTALVHMSNRLLGGQQPPVTLRRMLDEHFAGLVFSCEGWRQYVRPPERACRPGDPGTDEVRVTTAVDTLGRLYHLVNPVDEEPAPPGRYNPDRSAVNSVFDPTSIRLDGRAAIALQVFMVGLSRHLPADSHGIPTPPVPPIVGRYFYVDRYLEQVFGVAP